MWYISFFIIFADGNVKAFIERTSDHSKYREKLWKRN